MKPNLFFDFDGMKFDTIPAQVAYLNNRYGINTTISEYFGSGKSLDHVIEKYIISSTVTRDQVYKDFGKNFITSKEWHENVQPMEGMTKILPQLSKDYTLWTVTARQERGMEIIKYLLNTHVPGCIADDHIHCVFRDHGDTFIGISKKKFIQTVPGKKAGFFDDSPHEIEETKKIVPSYLFDPYNLHKRIDGAHYLQSWYEIAELFCR